MNNLLSDFISDFPEVFGYVPKDRCTLAHIQKHWDILHGYFVWIECNQIGCNPEYNFWKAHLNNTTWEVMTNSDDRIMSIRRITDELLVF